MPIFVRGKDSNRDGKLSGDGKGVSVGSTDTTGRNAGISTLTGTLIYNTTTTTIQVYNGTPGWTNVSQQPAPANPADYPIGPTYNAVYTTPWTGNPGNLPISDSNSTWTAPSTATRARVIVVGAGGGWPASYHRGRGAVVDALIDITGGASYKVIVGEKGADTSSTGTGGHGCGGGPGVDENDTGSGSGGSAFFFAPPAATSDPAMFPNGVLIAGAGGGGDNGDNGGQSHAAAGTGPSPDPIGGFSGISRKGSEPTGSGEPGGIGGIGGRVRDLNGPLVGPNAARGVGGSGQFESYPVYHGGTGGGAGAGGYGGGPNPIGPNAENAPNGRGYGYGGYNTSGAGRGGDYPMRGGNGFTFQGVNLGGGGGGSHGSCAGSGGWGGGGGAYYDLSGGSGGSGAWGYVTGTATITPLPSSGPPSININGGNLGANTPFPTTAGLENTDGAIIIMWYEPS